MHTEDINTWANAKNNVNKVASGRMVQGTCISEHSAARNSLNVYNWS